MPRQGLFTAALLARLPNQTTAHAQMLWGGMQGEVADLSGAAIPGAWVGVSSPAYPRGMSAVTDRHGRYVFPVGSYTVSVSAPGSHTLRYTNLEVRVGQQVEFNARLSLGAVTESVDVNDSLQAHQSPHSRSTTYEPWDARTCPACRQSRQGLSHGFLASARGLC